MDNKAALKRVGDRLRATRKANLAFLEVCGDYLWHGSDDYWPVDVPYEIGVDDAVKPEVFDSFADFLAAQENTKVPVDFLEEFVLCERALAVMNDFDAMEYNLRPTIQRAGEQPELLQGNERGQFVRVARVLREVCHRRQLFEQLRYELMELYIMMNNDPASTDDDSDDDGDVGAAVGRAVQFALNVHSPVKGKKRLWLRTLNLKITSLVQDVDYLTNLLALMETGKGTPHFSAFSFSSSPTSRKEARKTVRHSVAKRIKLEEQNMNPVGTA
ncbi:uncharacterized protein LOC120906006 [Anopheles arabiensis]|uniref:Uncharacterized protein n=1 Tax=Anopheles arabiensis TaxID=7173 RepID=A0A182HIJ8_ANOAR|nr:uncharacterized protein LOC120906006 [Anopheles arabiensis]